MLHLRLVTVRALKSFDDFRAGEVYQLMLTDPIVHLIVNQYFDLLVDEAWGVAHGSGANLPGGSDSEQQRVRDEDGQAGPAGG
jgi:hypothetical protein